MATPRQIGAWVLAATLTAGGLVAGTFFAVKHPAYEQTAHVAELRDRATRAYFDPSVVRITPNAAQIAKGQLLANGRPVSTTRASTRTCTRGIDDPKQLIFTGESLETWSDDHSGVAAQVVTTDAATTPAGTGAERIDFPAVSTAGTWSVRDTGTASVPAGTYTITASVLGVSGGGTIYVSEGIANQAAACAFNASTWTRCALTVTRGSANVLVPSIGVDLRAAGVSAQPAQSIYVGDFKAEAGSSATAVVPSSATLFDASNTWTNPENVTGDYGLPATLGPFGEATAGVMTDDATNSFHGAARCYGDRVNSGSGPFTWTVHMAAGTSRYANLTLGTGRGCVFDLQTGAVAYQDSVGIDACAISSAANGFWRARLTTHATEPNECFYTLVNAPGLLIGTPTYSGSGSTIKIAAFKLETGTTATPYVPGNNQKIVGLGGGLACVESPGVLTEGTDANLLLYSEQADNGIYRQLAATVTANTDVSLDGTFTADRVYEDTSTGGHQWDQPIASLAGSTVYTVSFFVKPGPVRDWALITKGGGSAQQAYFNIRNCTPGTSKSSAVTLMQAKRVGAYCRISAGITMDPAQGSAYLGLAFASADGTSSIVGNASSYMVVSKGQVEQRWEATSYMGPTFGSIAIRNGDVHTIPIPLTGSSGCIALTATPVAGGVDPAGFYAAQIGSPGGITVIYQPGDVDFASYVGAQYISAGGSFTADTPKRYLAEWTATTNRLCNLTAGTCNTSTFASHAGAGKSNLVLGDNGNGSSYWLRDIVYGNAPGKCR